ncbi:sodium/panthothenate symporter, partial [gut metagenome]
ASSAIVKDLLLRKKPSLMHDEHRLARFTRLLTGALGVLALVLAIKPLDVVAWINMFAFGGLELSILLPLIGGLFWRRATAAGALVSVAGGLFVYLTVSILKIPVGGFHAIVPGMLTALVLFVAGSLLTAPTAAKNLALFFPKRPGDGESDSKKNGLPSD